MHLKIRPCPSPDVHRMAYKDREKRPPMQVSIKLGVWGDTKKGSSAESFQHYLPLNVNQRVVSSASILYYSHQVSNPHIGINAYV